MRILDFFDGFSSATEPILQFIAAGKLATYASDAAYEAAKGSAGEEGDIYWNTTDKVIRLHNGTNWGSIQTNFPMEYELASGAIDGVNQVYTLTNPPISDKHLSVIVNGLVLEPSEFSLVGNTITLTSPLEVEQTIYSWYFYDGDAPVVSAPSGLLNTPDITLTATDITNKYASIVNTAIEPTKVRVWMVGVGVQLAGVDYQIIGDEIHWNGLGLDGFLEENDILSLYFYS